MERGVRDAIVLVVIILFFLGYYLTYQTDEKTDQIDKDRPLPPDGDVYQGTDQEIGQGTDSKGNGLRQDTTDQFQNVSGLHWSHMPLTYNYVNKQDCGNILIIRIDKAFQKLQEESNSSVSFVEVDHTGDFNIECVAGEDQQEYKKKFGKLPQGITEIETKDNIITNAKITFWVDGPIVCETYPVKEIRGILWGFGFEFKEDKWHILNYNSAYCANQINKDVIEKIIEDYRGE